MIKMSDLNLYPASPDGVPEGITHAKASYKRQAWLAMSGLLGFMIIYLALATFFGLIAYENILTLQTGKTDLFHIIVTFISLLLLVFMVKSLFSVKKSGDPGGVEVTATQEPKLFKFLHQLAEEIGAPKPHRVFITAEVNAAVFYDLSLINLIFPSKKNLIIGLGLVNVLNLGELKAVLAHEFGHFAQGSMVVGRWVYIAQQIIAYMVATRDWLDSVVRFVSRFDLRIAWVGWILALIIWSIRSLMDTLFRIVVIAERALSREMEFNADLVAVSVTGSDAIVNALHKLQAADSAWQTTLDVAESEAANGKFINNLFIAQLKAISTIAEVLNDEHFGVVPENKSEDPSQHRVFTMEMARPPQMWSTHPANRDREDNAKNIYIPNVVDNRKSWLIFSDAEELKRKISHSFYNPEKRSQMESISAEDAVTQQFAKASFATQYRGTYMNRSPVRNFSSVDEMLQTVELSNTAKESIARLYPESISEQLDKARNLDLERNTLLALESGSLKPAGGVIRHRGKELNKSDIAEAIEQVADERKAIAELLKKHDALCRKAHLQAAKQLGNQWHDYLLGLIRLLHCSEHLGALVNNERALLVNTWQVITADGQIGHFEKRRMLKVCEQVQSVMRIVANSAIEIELPESISFAVGIDNWKDQCPRFEIDKVDKKNWGQWCQEALQIMDNLHYGLSLVQSETLQELINTEAKLAKHINENTSIDKAPTAKNCPKDYPVLIPGNEHVLQYKLDLWNRFQLAHGLFPTMMRLVVAMAIVGGTIYGGIVGF